MDGKKSYPLERRPRMSIRRRNLPSLTSYIWWSRRQTLEEMFARWLKQRIRSIYLFKAPSTKIGQKEESLDHLKSEPRNSWLIPLPVKSDIPDPILTNLFHILGWSNSFCTRSKFACLPSLCLFLRGLGKLLRFERQMFCVRRIEII